MSGDAELDNLLGDLAAPSKASDVAPVAPSRGVIKKYNPPAATSHKAGGSLPVKGVHHDDEVDNILAHMNFDPDAEDSHATCLKCHEAILMSHEYVEVARHKYHTKCWLCSTCHKQLLNHDFFESHPGAHNCADCHKKTLDVCPGCHQHIQGGAPVVNVEGRKYHDKCWVCNVCRSPLTSYHERDGKVWCQTHFNEKYNPKCVSCSRPITGTYAETKKGQYHVDCFKCNSCHRAIGSDKYFDSPSGVLCGNCKK